MVVERLKYQGMVGNDKIDIFPAGCRYHLRQRIERHPDPFNLPVAISQLHAAVVPFLGKFAGNYLFDSIDDLAQFTAHYISYTTYVSRIVQRTSFVSRCASQMRSYAIKKGVVRLNCHAFTINFSIA